MLEFPVRWLLLLFCSVVANGSLGQFWQEVWVEPPGEVTANGRFGASISIEGDRLLIGAPGSNGGVPGSGAAYLYKRNEEGLSTWGFVARLEPPVLYTSGGFGTKVVLHQGGAYVSAPREQVQGITRGAIHRFEPVMDDEQEHWVHRQIIYSDTAQADLRTGEWFSVREELCVASGPGFDQVPPDQEPGAGALLAFSRSSGSDFVGSRSVNGDDLNPEDGPLCTSAPCELSGWCDLVAGHLVYTTSNAKAYTLPVEPLLDAAMPLVPLPVLLTDTFGYQGGAVLFNAGAVHGDEDLVLVGEAGYPVRRPVAVSFRATDVGFLQNGHMIPDTTPTTGDPRFWRWGYSVATGQQRVAVGDPGDILFTPLGYVEVFDRHEGMPGGWHRLVKLLPSDPENGAVFGSSVALGDGVVAVGAPGFGGADRGKVYVFHDPSVGIEVWPYTEPSTLRVYPDPVASGGRLHVDLPRVPGHLHAYSIEGRAVAGWGTNGPFDLELSGWPPGRYLLVFSPSTSDPLPLVGAVIVQP